MNASYMAGSKAAQALSRVLRLGWGDSPSTYSEAYKMAQEWTETPLGKPSPQWREGFVSSMAGFGYPLEESS